MKENAILVVEDISMNRRLIRDILEYHRYEVVEAENGAEAIRIARECLPCLILMDLQMPVMNGLEAAGILKNDPLTKEIKIVAITSFAMAGDKDRVLAAGFDEYVSKPLNTRELPALIKRLLSSAT